MVAVYGDDRNIANVHKGGENWRLGIAPTSYPETHPDIHSSFLNGLHVIQRSERYWAGLSTDLVIEQVLMRSIKTNGGLTRGRGLTEIQRVIWLLSMPFCADVS